jgi:hypothetical protein
MPASGAGLSIVSVVVGVRLMRGLRRSRAGITIGHRMVAAPLIEATGVFLLFLGCSGPTGPKPDTLTVKIEAPTGVTPDVTVSGPGGYATTLTATTTLGGLASGTYTVAARVVTTPDATVSAVYTATVSGSPATVGGPGEEAEVRYALRPGSGGLWVASYLGRLYQYTATQLTVTTGSVAPTTTLAVNPGGSAQVVAFDANGDLWTFKDNSLAEYTPRQLSSGGAPTPAISVATTLVSPAGLAFDSRGDLWVADAGSHNVVEFSASQLVSSSGSAMPAVVISSPNGANINLPVGIAFDGGGNLWVANSVLNDVVEFTPEQLVASGSPTPAVTLAPAANSIQDPSLIAFDAAGNLWVPNTGTVVEFSRDQLTASGSPTPVVILNSTGLDRPAGIAFDASGDLWVANINSGILEFSPSQIERSGKPTPHIVPGNTPYAFGLAFDPHAPGVPIRPQPAAQGLGSGNQNDR